MLISTVSTMTHKANSIAGMKIFLKNQNVLFVPFNKWTDLNTFPDSPPHFFKKIPIYWWFIVKVIISTPFGKTEHELISPLSVVVKNAQSYPNTDSYYTRT